MKKRRSPHDRRCRLIDSAALATVEAAPTGDTYADVNDHPGSYQGDRVQWTCNIYKFLDNNTIACWEYTGTYDGGTGDGSLALDTSSSNVDINSLHSGDDIRVLGTVQQPFQGTNGFGASVTSPGLSVKSIQDLGHDPNATK
jgi:hypothetical protein